jgi:hypothetical protein
MSIAIIAMSATRGGITDDTRATAALPSCVRNRGGGDMDCDRSSVAPASAFGPRIHSNRANDRGLQSHRVYAHLGESRVSERRGDLVTPHGRRRIRCSGTARLVGDCDAASRTHDAAQLLEAIDRLIPEHDRVDGQNLVERLREHWRAINGTEPQIDPARPNGGGVASAA